MGKKVLLFGDIGIDDTIALMYAYCDDIIEIVGVVADYGNVSRENALSSTEYVKSLFPRKKVEKVKLIAGAHIPMTGEVPTYVPEIHGEYGLGPIIPPKSTHKGSSDNFFEVVDLIKAYKDELIIVNIGRLTSLATLFLLYRSLMQSIKAYYIMGGAFWVPGNITAVSEANIYGDPVAAQVVLTNAKNVKIIPLNVTNQAIVTPQMINYLDQVGQVPLVKELLDYYYRFYKKRNPAIQGAPLHDVVTLMAVKKSNLFSYQSYPVYIVQAASGVARGQSIADIRPYADLTKTEGENIIGGKVHEIAFKLDYPRFYRDFMAVMTKEIVE